MSALSVSEAFSDLADPRMERTRLHSLQDILVIALCAVLCGAEGWDDFVEFAHAKRDWLEARLTLSNGIPCADTFRRVFDRLAPEAFGAGFLRWTQAAREASKASSLSSMARRFAIVLIRRRSTKRFTWSRHGRRRAAWCWHRPPSPRRAMR